MYTEFFSLSLR